MGKACRVVYNDPRHIRLHQTPPSALHLIGKASNRLHLPARKRNSRNEAVARLLLVPLPSASAIPFGYAKVHLPRCNPHRTRASSLSPSHFRSDSGSDSRAPSPSIPPSLK
ncbi:hypothetical protein BCV70DRAFT_117361 [Testicularia cyperi]|uniref:Uncharacterized protein n=1 Tax=Testicularia cyperi TaxID=1882483 RepID=A0A317XQ02_9BASI|nr:hypothetical protein BCV70DRAFT_117361 [Testicularia cyperi]